MRKRYVSPLTVAVVCQPSVMVSASTDITSDRGIDYGGVDEEGTMDPAARRYNSNVWEEEEEEELEDDGCW